MDGNLMILKINAMISVIYYVESDNVIGGYTSEGWIGKPTRMTYYNDDKTFLFSIRSCEQYPAAIFNGKKSEETMFGKGCYLWIDGEDKNRGVLRVTNKTSYFI